MTTTTPQAAAFVEAARAFVEHIATAATAGVEAHQAGHLMTALAMLDMIEAEIAAVADNIRDGHKLDRASAMRYSDAALGLDELLPELSLLSGLVDGDHHEAVS